MDCKERIEELEAAIDALETDLATLRAMPDADTDPAIIAAIAQVESSLTSLRIQLANVKTECAVEETAVPAVRARAIRSASRSIVKARLDLKKAVLAASKALVRHARSLGDKAGKPAPKKAVRKSAKKAANARRAAKAARRKPSK